MSSASKIPFDNLRLAVSAYTNKDPKGEEEAVQRVVSLLQDCDVTTADQLDEIVKEAKLRDAARFLLLMLGEYSSLLIRAFAPYTLFYLVNTYREGTIVFLLNCILPAFCSSYLHRSLRKLGPRYNISLPPRSDHPLLHRRPLASLYPAPLYRFTGLELACEFACALANRPEWAPSLKPGGCIIAALIEAYDVWAILDADHQCVRTENNEVIYQSWLDSEDNEQIRRHVRALLSRHDAIRDFCLDFATFVFLGLPGNVVYALLTPTTFAGVLSFAPSAWLTLLAKDATDEIDALLFNILAACAAVGTKMTPPLQIP